MDNLGLVEAIDGFREGIVVTIANTADRRLNARFRQALGVLDREGYCVDSSGRRKRRMGLTAKGPVALPHHAHLFLK
jgi:hypothetical protein